MFDGFPTLTPLHGRPDGRRGADALRWPGTDQTGVPWPPRRSINRIGANARLVQEVDFAFVPLGLA